MTPGPSRQNVTAAVCSPAKRTPISPRQSSLSVKASSRMTDIVCGPHLLTLLYCADFHSISWSKYSGFGFAQSNDTEPILRCRERLYVVVLFLKRSLKS